MGISSDKSAYNKTYSQNNKAFPVRLGPLKELIQSHAFDVEGTIHSCIVKALEIQYLPQLIENAKKCRFNDVVELLEVGYNLQDALRELHVPEVYFYLSVPEERLNQICLMLRPKQADLLRRKVGYYNFIREENKIP